MYELKGPSFPTLLAFILSQIDFEMLPMNVLIGFYVNEIAFYNPNCSV